MKSQGEKKESKKVEGRKEGRRKDDEFRLVSWSLAATCWIPSQETANRNTLRTRWLRRFSLTYFWLGFEFHFYMQKLRVRCYPYGCHEGTRQTENSANTVSSKLNYCNYLRSDRSKIQLLFARSNETVHTTRCWLKKGQLRATKCSGRLNARREIELRGFRRSLRTRVATEPQTLESEDKGSRFVSSARRTRAPNVAQAFRPEDKLSFHPATSVSLFFWSKCELKLASLKLIPVEQQCKIRYVMNRISLLLDINKVVLSARYRLQNQEIRKCMWNVKIHPPSKIPSDLLE